MTSRKYKQLPIAGGVASVYKLMYMFSFLIISKRDTVKRQIKIILELPISAMISIYKGNEEKEDYHGTL